MSESTLQHSGDFTSRAYVIVRYVLLILALNVAVGFVFGLGGITRSLGAASYHIGPLNSVALLKLFGKLAVCFFIYLRLARKHPQHYFADGALIAAGTGILSFISSQLLDPRGTPTVRVALLAVSILFHVAYFLVVGALVRKFVARGTMSSRGHR